MSDDFVFKSVDFALKSSDVVKEESGDFFVFSGYGSTWEVDSDLDQIVPGAFSESISKDLPSLLWSHDRWQPAIGLITEAKEDETGLFITAKMPVADNRVATMLKPQIELGSIDRMSIGFRIKRFEIITEPEPGEADRLISDLELMEISLVNKNFAANEGARITELEKELAFLKASGKDIDKKQNDAVKQLFEVCELLEGLK